MRFFNRGRTSSQRGFVLGAALLLAILYFALMELMMLDSTLQLQAADRFRAQVIAAALAESAAERAAVQMVSSSGNQIQTSDSQGTMIGRYDRLGPSKFELSGEATSKGVPAEKATVHLQGSINGTRIAIDYSTHSQ